LENVDGLMFVAVIGFHTKLPIDYELTHPRHDQNVFFGFHFQESFVLPNIARFLIRKGFRVPNDAFLGGIIEVIRGLIFEINEIYTRVGDPFL
jgi:hypothetical protein